MVKKITFTADARATFDSIFQYLIEEWSEKTAVDFLHKVFQVINNIHDLPEMYLLHSKKKNVRRALITPHTGMYYRIKESEIEILIFFDQRQNPKKLKLK